MNLIRAYKLQLLGIPITEKDKVIIDYLDDKFNDLKPFVLLQRIYYMNSKGVCILEKSQSYKDAPYEIYVRYNNFWETLEYEYKVNYFYIHEILPFWIKKDLLINTKNINTKISFHSVENEYRKYLNNEPSKTL